MLGERLQELRKDHGLSQQAGSPAHPLRHGAEHRAHEHRDHHELEKIYIYGADKPDLFKEAGPQQPQSRPQGKARQIEHRQNMLSFFHTKVYLTENILLIIHAPKEKGNMHPARFRGLRSKKRQAPPLRVSL